MNIKKTFVVVLLLMNCAVHNILSNPGDGKVKHEGTTSQLRRRKPGKDEDQKSNVTAKVIASDGRETPDPPRWLVVIGCCFLQIVRDPFSDTLDLGERDKKKRD